MQRIILTGATGVLGSKLASELAQRGCEVHCIVRPSRQMSAEDRLRKYVGSFDGRVVAHSGDITLAGCRADLSRFPQRIDKVVHCAADVRFDDEHADEIHETNFEGTKNVLALANLFPALEFHYVSTAYIGGDTSWLQERLVPDMDQRFIGDQRNAYERSKFRTEQMISERHERSNVYRPSIVVGNSADGSISGFDGYYGFFKGLWRLKRSFAKRPSASKSIHFEGDELFLPVTLEANSLTRLNLVPVDWVARTMTDIIVRPARGEAYNLTHSAPPHVDFVIRESLKVLGMRGVAISEALPRSTGDRALDQIQRMVTRGIKRYQPYVTHSPRFTSKNAERLLGAGFQSAPDISADFLAMTLRYAMSAWEAERMNVTEFPEQIRHTG